MRRSSGPPLHARRRGVRHGSEPLTPGECKLGRGVAVGVWRACRREGSRRIARSWRRRCSGIDPIPPSIARSTTAGPRSCRRTHLAGVRDRFANGPSEDGLVHSFDSRPRQLEPGTSAGDAGFRDIIRDFLQRGSRAGRLGGRVAPTTPRCWRRSGKVATQVASGLKQEVSNGESSARNCRNDGLVCADDT